MLFPLFIARIITQEISLIIVSWMSLLYYWLDAASFIYFPVSAEEEKCCDINFIRVELTYQPMFH